MLEDDLRAPWLASLLWQRTYPDPAKRTNQRLRQRRTHRTYVGRLERGKSGVTVEALAAILATLGENLALIP